MVNEMAVGKSLFFLRMSVVLTKAVGVIPALFSNYILNKLTLCGFYGPAWDSMSQMFLNYIHVIPKLTFG
jgi:hypothetical protein